MRIRGSESYLFLSEIIGKVGDHDLGSGWDTVFGRSTLLGCTGSTGLVGGSSGVGSLVCVVGDIGQWQRSIGNGIITATSRSSTSAPATAPATTSSTCATLVLAFGTLFLLSLVWLASKLNRDLAFEDVFAREVLDGFIGFVGGL